MILRILIFYVINIFVWSNKFDNFGEIFLSRIFLLPEFKYEINLLTHFFLLSVDSIPYKLILSHSMGYFAYDIIWCFKHNESFVVKLHHVVCCTGLIYYSFKLSRQYTIVYAIGMTEFTNPILQVRWYLKHHNMRHKLAFKIIEVLFVLSFSYVRVFVFTYYAYKSWTSTVYNFTYDDLFFLTLGLFVGYGLAWQLYGYIVYQLSKVIKAKSKKID